MKAGGNARETEARKILASAQEAVARCQEFTCATQPLDTLLA